MKWLAGLVAVFVVALSIAYFTVPRGPAPASLSAEPAAGTAAGDDTSRDRDPAVLVEDPALTRLRAELAASVPVSGVSDEDRLADATAWVRANRPPDYAYAQLEARILALLSTILDGDQRSPAWVMNLPALELEMIRALDADGDGTVTLDELRAYDEAGVEQLTELEHPYLLARIDTNGDGQLSPEERSVVDSVELFQQGAFAGLFDRAMIEAWDTDRDGILADTEREEGLGAAHREFGSFFDDQRRALEDQGVFDGEGGDERRAEFEASLAEQQARADQAEKMVMMQVARPFFQMMTLESPSSDAAESLRAPEPTDFDTDGDGRLGPEESDAYRAVLDEYNQTTGGMNGYRLNQFRQVARLGDANHDGQFTPAEWDGYLDTLIADRNRRLFLGSYDADASGTVSSAELMTFLDWHRAGSLRADANYDGLVDARDLEHAMIEYQKLNR